MKFHLDVNITEQDYLDFNIFFMTRSDYGKKQIRSLRILMAVLLILAGILLFIFSDNLISAIATETFLLVMLIVFMVTLPRLSVAVTKNTIKKLTKSGKPVYSPSSTLDFGEDTFIETTPENKTEQKYSVIERIIIVNNKVVYLHLNKLVAYIIPMSCFASNEQCIDFLNFIKDKCPNAVTDIY